MKTENKEHIKTLKRYLKSDIINIKGRIEVEIKNGNIKFLELLSDKLCCVCTSVDEEVEEEKGEEAYIGVECLK